MCGVGHADDDGYERALSHPTLTMSAPGDGDARALRSPPSAIAGVARGQFRRHDRGDDHASTSFGPQASAPTTCPARLERTVGTASPTGDGTWSPAAGYTPPSSTNATGGTRRSPATPTTIRPRHVRCGHGVDDGRPADPDPDDRGAGDRYVRTRRSGRLDHGDARRAAAAARLRRSRSTSTARRRPLPATCTGAGWTQVGGTITPSGNGSYNPSAGYTPPHGGTYWWYATYAGDANNNPTPDGLQRLDVVDERQRPDTFAFSNIGTPTAGTSFNVTLTATSQAGGTDTELHRRASASPSPARRTARTAQRRLYPRDG